VQVLWIELRRSPLRWLLPALLALEVSMLFTRSTEWIGVWPQASAAAQMPVGYLGPLVAAGAAWVAGREWRERATESLAAYSLPHWRRHGLHLLAILVIALVPYGIGIVCAYSASFSSASVGFLWLSYLTLGLCAIALCVAIGYALGVLFKGKSMGPLIAFPLTLFLLSVKYQDEYFLGALSGPVQLRVDSSALFARTTFVVVMCCSVVALAGFRSDAAVNRQELVRRPVFLLTAVTVALAVVGSLIGIATTGPLRIERSAPASPLCGGTPTVCMWPEQQKYHSDAMEMAARLRATASGLLPVPLTFYEGGLRSGPGSESDFTTRFGRWGIAQGFVGALHFGDGCTITAGRDEEYYRARFEFDQWLTSRTYGASRPAEIHSTMPIDVDAVNAVLAKPVDAQRAWAAERVATMRDTCV
jgi:hypothetical protein